MRRLLPLLPALGAAVVLALGAPATSSASATQEAMFQDDNQLIYTTRDSLDARLDTLKALGVDRIRATILWYAIAPDGLSRTKPSFDATNPDDYATGIWDHYDALVEDAYARGIKVNFDVTGPSPLWANRTPPRPDIADNYEPSPSEFAQFVTAVGRRYSGSWPDPIYPAATIPRVDYWSIWNEPNASGWLTPTWQRSGKTWYERSASLYRELADAAYGALTGTGHGSDTILFGDTAPAGNGSKNVKRYMPPMTFVRALYCVDRRLHRLTGRRAKLLGCGKSPSGFRAAHPVLFKATGFAHHPYQLLTAPTVKPRDPDIVTMAVLSRLTGALDTIQRRYSSKRRFPLYLTEYGYQTPPDPLGVPLLTQAAYLNQSEFIAARNPRVRSLAQFLLYDDGAPVNKTFQSGLLSHDGRPKPAFAAYQVPAWLYGTGSHRHLWGVLRPAAANAKATARVQYRAPHAKSYRTLRRVTAHGTRNVVRATIRARRGGSVRILYGKLRSRTVPVP
ncbi:MAG: hypothetical protein QOE86_4130 [Solirubrobacteraceae bacterium]|nr:hypothetical protein [Solirubrobacteraceae bacterium]